jgi:hypothetical protein
MVVTHRSGSSAPNAEIKVVFLRGPNIRGR